MSDEKPHPLVANFNWRWPIHPCHVCSSNYEAALKTRLLLNEITNGILSSASHTTLITFSPSGANYFYQSI